MPYTFINYKLDEMILDEMRNKSITLDKLQEKQNMDTPPKQYANFAEALEDIIENNLPSIVVPYFITTNREKYIKAVLKLCRRELMKPDEHVRMFLLYQEGVTKRESRSIWDEIISRANNLPNMDKDNNLNVYSFGNVHTDIINAFIDNAATVEHIKE